MESTKPKRFDYKAALREVMEPAVRREVTGEALHLYQLLRDHADYEKLAQAKDLDVPMPESLRKAFEAIPSDALAYAARVLHCLGHWGGMLDAGKPDTRGATWKFANLADQVLRKRLGLGTRSERTPNGWSFQVHDGMLRLCASSPDSWSWTELGPATENFLEHARGWLCSLPIYTTRSRKATEEWTSEAWKATRKCPDILLGQLEPKWAALLGIGERYMRPEGKCMGDCPECGKQSLWGKAKLDHTRECSKYPVVEELALEAIKALDALRAECEKRGMDFGGAYVAKQSVEAAYLSQAIPA